MAGRHGAAGGPRPSRRNDIEEASIRLPSQVTWNTLMTLCPSDEKLARLLADTLSTAERDASRGTWKDALLPGTARPLDRDPEPRDVAARRASVSGLREPKKR